MKLESLTLEVRPRTPWEAMDLAVRLVMSHWRILLSSWMVTIFPLFIIINIILLREYHIWAFMLVWFLKPLYDRVPLFVLSRVIFAEKTTYKDVINAIPMLLKTGVISSLTLYRLDPGRAFGLPVRQLEALKGKRRKQRMNTLGRGTNNREVLFFILCFHLESLISIGLIGFLLMMLPTDMAIQGAETVFLNEEPELLTNSLSMAFYFIVMMLVETLYVAGGFVLYLNRRIILEGWDIELVFRKLSARQTQLKPHLQTISTFLIGATLFLFSCVLPHEVQAASQNSSTAYEVILPPINQTRLAPEESSQVINDIMDGPVFNRFKQTEILKYTGDKDKDKKNKKRNYLWLTDAMEAIGKTLAFIFEMGLWILVLIAIFLLVKYRDRLRIGFSRKSQSSTTLPETLFGLDLREESLPEHVAEQALLLYQQQDYRAAMALLYRATLAYLVKNYQFDLKKGATEGDCLTLVTKKLSLPTQAELNYFVDLTRAWQLTAYAHRTVSEEEMKQLCLNWSRYYESNSNDDETQGQSSQGGINE